MNFIATAVCRPSKTKKPIQNFLKKILKNLNKVYTLPRQHTVLSLQSDYTQKKNNQTKKIIYVFLNKNCTRVSLLCG
jgi:superfamily I DNA and/or RNA helicase